MSLSSVCSSPKSPPPPPTASSSNGANTGAGSVSSSTAAAAAASSSAPAAELIEGAALVKVQSYEFRRDLCTSAWESIKVGSLDWHEITSAHSNALVVRVSSIVNENEPEEVMERLRAEDFASDAPTPALHVVCMFKEFAVSESSPVRFTANFLFIFPSLRPHKPGQFKEAIRRVLPRRSISYITAEMLGSFLARRDYEAHSITKVDAQDRLAAFINAREPCSSFFLKMSPVVPEFCRSLLLELGPGEARDLVGVRAIHKLAISCTSSSMASQHNFNETMNVMKMGVDPRHWNFVVFKTLMRLATKNDRIRRRVPHAAVSSKIIKANAGAKQSSHIPSGSQVDHMHQLIVDSELDALEKLAVRIISSSEDPNRKLEDDQQELVDFMVNIITSEKDYLSNEDFKRLLNIVEDGRPAACHLTGVLLEKCIEEENFNIGWRIASTVESVNEHTIEEVVTLCSKAFFKYSRNQAAEASKWFNRVKWCFERHHKLLGKYPSGLALHVAAHRRDFDLCWRWFQGKREDRAFRFSAHHTSSILKAASYAPQASKHMKEVLQAYDMTPVSQKSAFVFEPLVHLWNATADCRDEYRVFWVSVEHDLHTYLQRELKDPDPVDRKMRKLTHWQRVLAEWSADSYMVPNCYTPHPYPLSMQQQHPQQYVSPCAAAHQSFPMRFSPQHQPQKQQHAPSSSAYSGRRSGSWTPPSTSSSRIASPHQQAASRQQHGWGQYASASGRSYTQSPARASSRSSESADFYGSNSYRWSGAYLNQQQQQQQQQQQLDGALSDDLSDYGYSTSPGMGWASCDDRWAEQPGMVVGSPNDSLRHSISSPMVEQSYRQQQQWTPASFGRASSLDQECLLSSHSWATAQAHLHQEQMLMPALSSSVPSQSASELFRGPGSALCDDHMYRSSSLSRSFGDEYGSSMVNLASTVEGTTSSSWRSRREEDAVSEDMSASSSPGPDPDTDSKVAGPKAWNRASSQPQWTHAVGLPM